MTFDRRRSELEARSLRRLDLPRVYHENQIAELDAHNFDQFFPQRRQRPVTHRPGQHSLPQEVAQVVCQHEQLQPHLVVRVGAEIFLVR
jgi:hypothetical protein